MAELLTACIGLGVVALLLLVVTMLTIIYNIKYRG